MLTIKYQNAFKKDFKLAKKRGCNIQKLEHVIECLAKEEALPASYKDHALVGNFSGCRECHIAPDWLLIYEVNNAELTLYLMRCGSHSDLF